MNPARFTKQKPGELIRISDRLSEWAFVPSPLPPEGWRLPDHLSPMLRAAGTALGKLDGIGRILPNPELLLRPLANREALASSSIEGTYASPEELLLYAEGVKSYHVDKDADGSTAEVFKYAEALRQGWEESENRPLTLNLIKRMHQTLLGGVRGKDRDPGNFRRLQVCVGSDARYVPPPAQYLPDLLSQLQTYINAPGDDPTDLLVRCFLAHYQFETIHPFLDGNGRIGRAILATMIGRAEGHLFPWLYLSPYFEKHKDEYVDRLFGVSAKGTWSEWVEFCLRGTILQANDAITRCDSLRRLRDNYLSRVGTDGSPRTRKIVDDLFVSPFVSVSRLAKLEKVTYPTAKSDLQLLSSLGIVKVLAKFKPITYYSTDIYDICYTESGRLRKDIDTSEDNQSGSYFAAPEEDIPD